MLRSTPPRQSSLPKKQVLITDHQKFNIPTLARVTKNDHYFSQSKIEVVFLNRTAPVPIWVLNSGASVKPEVGDYVLVDYIDGQKNNPYMVGLVSHKAYTSNFIRVEKDMIRIQFPTNPNDVLQGQEDNSNSHLRNDAAYLASRYYIQIDGNGVTIKGKNGTTIF